MTGATYSPEVIALAEEMLRKHLDLIGSQKTKKARKKTKKKSQESLALKSKKKEPLHQQERSARSALKRKAASEVGIRFRVSFGIKEKLSSIMEWSGIEEQAEAITLAIHHLHGKGSHGALQALEYQVSIGEKDRPEEIRMRARPGTMQAMAELMDWAGISDRGEFVDTLIARLHALGGVESIPLLSPPRHNYQISEAVARKLNRAGRDECLTIGLDE